VVKLIRDLRKANANSDSGRVLDRVVAGSFTTRNDAEIETRSYVENNATRASDSGRLGCDAVLLG
jgi:hypothetical protein